PYSDIVPEEKVTAKTWVGAAGQRWSCRIRRGRFQGADAESHINFLRLCEIRKRRHRSAGKRTQNGNTYYPFQSKPPLLILKRWMRVKRMMMPRRRDFQDFTITNLCTLAHI